MNHTSNFLSQNSDMFNIPIGSRTDKCLASSINQELVKSHVYWKQNGFNGVWWIGFVVNVHLCTLVYLWFCVCLHVYVSMDHCGMIILQMERSYISWHIKWFLFINCTVNSGKNSAEMSPRYVSANVSTASCH